MQLDGRRTQSGAPQVGSDLDQVRARAHQQRDRCRWSLRADGPHDLDHLRRFIPGSPVDEAVHDDGGIERRRVHRRCGFERHGATDDVAFRRQHAREHAIHPLDDARLRAEVPRELERLQRQRPDTAVPRAQEQADLRLAETVDRLHRVTDHEQRAAIPSRPVGDESLDEFELGDRGVLELVDQQMTQARVERKRNVAGLLVAKRLHGAMRHFAEIHRSRFGKHDPQFAGRPPQHIDDGPDDGPVVIRVPRRRKPPQPGQRLA
ncbi:MAG: hypothetical protein WBA53_12025 [Burkholderiaceae bacterium]